MREQVLQQVTSLMRSTAPEHPCQILVTGTALSGSDVPLLPPMLAPRVAVATRTLHLAGPTDILKQPSTIWLHLLLLHVLSGIYDTPLLLLTVAAGHSLGGALAQLAAYEIKMNCANSGADVKVSCYILGAPRVGNAAFAQAFEATGGLRYCSEEQPCISRQALLCF